MNRQFSGGLNFAELVQHASKCLDIVSFAHRGLLGPLSIEEESGLAQADEVTALLEVVHDATEQLIGVKLADDRLVARDFEVVRHEAHPEAELIVGVVLGFSAGGCAG